MEAAEIIREWPEESREAASEVIKKYGEPTESTPSQLEGRRKMIFFLPPYCSGLGGSTLPRLTDVL